MVVGLGGYLGDYLDYVCGIPERNDSSSGGSLSLDGQLPAVERISGAPNPSIFVLTTARVG